MPCALRAWCQKLAFIQLGTVAFFSACLFVLLHGRACTNPFPKVAGRIPSHIAYKRCLAAVRTHMCRKINDYPKEEGLPKIPHWDANSPGAHRGSPKTLAYPPGVEHVPLKNSTPCLSRALLEVAFLDPFGLLCLCPMPGPPPMPGVVLFVFFFPPPAVLLIWLGRWGVRRGRREWVCVWFVFHTFADTFAECRLFLARKG